MQQTITRSLIETLVRSKLEDLKNSPERTTRNLVDMAFHFSKGRFQKRFFEIAQAMLENENSPYYQMVYHTVANVDNKRILNFGMNLGYNSCTYGAKIIRKTEEQFDFNVPWCITLELDKEKLIKAPEHYHQLLQEGKSLGIYTWHIFSHNCMNEFLPIIEMNPECAFFLFCTPKELTDLLLDNYTSITNVMFVLRYDERDTDIYHTLKERELLYSSYMYYNDDSLTDILNNELLCSINETDSSFVIFIADRTCSTEAKEQVADYVTNTINFPKYTTLPFEFYYHLNKIDSIISDDSCLAWFDKSGLLLSKDVSVNAKKLNHFTHSLSCILNSAFPKKH